MKVGLIGNPQRGMSTVEILIAIAILTLTISATIMVVFGNQSLAIDTQTNVEALAKAESQLEVKRAEAKADFYSVEDVGPVTEGRFRRSLIVHDRAQCLKQATSRVEWTQGGRDFDVSVTTLFADLSIALALGGDCDPIPPLGWEAPKTHSVADVIHNGSAATDVDVVQGSGKKIAAVTTTRSGTHETLWLIDVSNETAPVLLGAAAADDKDLLAVDITQQYVFVASASTTAQLQIFSITPPYDPGNPILVATSSLPGVSGAAPEAISIHYVNDRVYVGTKRTTGPEFHVFDVSALPAAPVFLGSLELNHNVHEVIVQDTYAYIASSANDCELIVIDVSVPASMVNPCPAPPVPAGNTVFNAAGTFDAMALDVAGNTVYLGRQRAQSSEDFLVLNTSDLTQIVRTGGKDLELNASTEVVGVESQWPLVFISTTDQTPANGGGPFLIYSVENAADPKSVPTCALNYSEKATGMDFLENIAYVSNESNDALAIIYPALSCSSL